MGVGDLCLERGEEGGREGRAGGTRVVLSAEHSCRMEEKGIGEEAVREDGLVEKKEELGAKLALVSSYRFG